MTIEELEQLDADERARLRAKAIEDVQRAIRLRSAARARTDALERHLVSLLERRWTTTR